MVDRVALILNVFDEPGKHLRLDQVAGRTGAAPILGAPDSQTVAQRRAPAAPAGRLRAGRLAAAGRPGWWITRSCAVWPPPTLSRLHADTGLVVHLGVLFGGDVVYLDKVAGRNSAGGAHPRRRAHRPRTPAPWERPCWPSCPPRRWTPSWGHG